jgi:hypothetical protein
MGYPLFILAGWLTWQVLKKVPSVKIEEPEQSPKKTTES